MSNIVCLDMEGVLVPEIWVAFSEKTGLPELKKTTRDEPDYDKLMQWKESLGKAYEAIEKYKTSDLSLYNKLEKRITRESVSLNYLITSIHRSEFDNITEYRDLLLKVYQDADKTGIVFWREVSAGSGRPESYFTVKGKLQELQG